jgi:Cu+-exporting ATPase
MQNFDSSSAAAETDPVCEMKVNPLTASHRFAYQGKTYYFCSALCKNLFEREPQKYVKEQTNSNAASQGLYAS